MILLDMIRAMGSVEMIAFLWLSFILDLPRYVLAVPILAFVRLESGRASRQRSVTGIVACHNEEHCIADCVASMQANGVQQIIVVNDGSTDRTHEVAVAAGALVLDNPARMSKPLSLNVGLAQATGETVLISDADTRFAPGSVAIALSYLEDGVGGVNFHIDVSNEDATLTTRFQAIEYLVTFTAGKQITDIFGIMSNVSGAAGLFRREALESVGRYDCEVAEDAALAMKLRAAGWQLRYAPDALAVTAVPETPVELLLQRLRWDASIITIWWRKFFFLLNPFSARFTPRNLVTSLDVLIFAALLPLVCPIYVVWMFNRIGEVTLIFLGTVMIALFIIELSILLLLELPPRLLAYVPYYFLVQMLVMRPFRGLALVAELCFNITKHDDYIPASQRHLLT